MVANTRSFEVSFTVPEMEQHYEQAVAAAAVSADGKEIKVGRYTATKIGLMGGSSFSSAGDWRVRSSDPGECLPHVPDKNSFCRYLPDASNNLIIHWLAELEAKRQTPLPAIAAAFQRAVEAELETLKSNPNGFVAQLYREKAVEEMARAIILKI